MEIYLLSIRFYKFLYFAVDSFRLAVTGGKMVDFNPPKKAEVPIVESVYMQTCTCYYLSQVHRQQSCASLE